MKSLYCFTCKVFLTEENTATSQHGSICKPCRNKRARDWKQKYYGAKPRILKVVSALPEMESELFPCDMEPQNEEIYKHWAKRCRPYFVPGYWEHPKNKNDSFKQLKQKGPASIAVSQKEIEAYYSRLNRRGQLKDIDSEKNQWEFGRQPIGNNDMLLDDEDALQ